MKKNYDLVVVGAGPVGSMAAKVAAENGASVLLLEKDRDIGIPVRCAEAVGVLGMNNVLGEIKPHWVSSKVTGFRLVAPDNQAVIFNSLPEGVVLNRKVFDFEVAMLAAAAGAEVHTKTFVNGLRSENGFVTGVKFISGNKNYEIGAKIVIGADGVEARVGRWAGLRKHFKLCDVESCAQVTAGNIDLNEKDFCHFYFGTQRAPGGYVWIFPKGGGLFNIGLGVGGDRIADIAPMDYLKRFLAENFPEASVLTTVVGGVPCAPALTDLVGNGIMLVGDAANQVNPISGGGIVRGMFAAKIAGRVAASAIQQGDVSEKSLKAYSREWASGEGKSHSLLYRIKQGIYKLSDDELNNTAAVLNKLPENDRTLVKMFRTALFNKPSLILDVVRALS
jgi:digeranylgeranylglycerophospholipid reductase